MRQLEFQFALQLLYWASALFIYPRPTVHFKHSGIQSRCDIAASLTKLCCLGRTTLTTRLLRARASSISLSSTPAAIVICLCWASFCRQFLFAMIWLQVARGRMRPLGPWTEVNMIEFGVQLVMV